MDSGGKDMVLCSVGFPETIVDPGSTLMDAYPVRYRTSEVLPIGCHSNEEYMVYWPMGFD